MIYEVIGEQFIKESVQAKSKPSLNNVYNLNEAASAPRQEVKTSQNDESLRQRQKEEVRKKMMEKLGVSNNPMMQELYEDVTPLSSTGIDEDDEGVDPSMFMRG